MSAINTALPRMSDAIAIDVVDKGWKCEPLVISIRTNVTMCSATKKKIVGGRILKNSSFSLVISGAFLSTEDGQRLSGDRPRKHRRTDRRIDQRQHRDDGLELLVHVCLRRSILTKLAPTSQGCCSKRVAAMTTPAPFRALPVATAQGTAVDAPASPPSSPRRKSRCCSRSSDRNCVDPCWPSRSV